MPTSDSKAPVTDERAEELSKIINSFIDVPATEPTRFNEFFHSLEALLASRALEARNEALEEAATLVDKFTNPLKVAEKLSWLESPMTFARVMEVISAEIRSLAAASKAAGGGHGGR